MVDLPTTEVRDARLALQSELELALGNSKFKDSLVKRGYALKLVKDGWLSCLTNRGVYLNFDNFAKQLVIIHTKGWRIPGDPDDLTFRDYQRPVRVREVLTLKQAAEYLYSKEVDVVKLREKLRELAA